jgi:hypothetical protein
MAKAGEFIRKIQAHAFSTAAEEIGQENRNHLGTTCNFTKLLDYAGGSANGQTVRRNIPGNNRIGAYDAVVADGNTLSDCNFRAQPHIITDDDWGSPEPCI